MSESFDPWSNDISRFVNAAAEWPAVTIRQHVHVLLATMTGGPGGSANIPNIYSQDGADTNRGSLSTPFGEVPSVIHLERLCVQISRPFYECKIGVYFKIQ